MQLDSIELKSRYLQNDNDLYLHPDNMTDLEYRLFCERKLWVMEVWAVAEVEVTTKNGTSIVEVTSHNFWQIKQEASPEEVKELAREVFDECKEIVVGMGVDEDSFEEMSGVIDKFYVKHPKS